MLKIRLQRFGRKKSPSYRIVIADVRAPRDGKFLEIVGTYQPMLAKDHHNRIQFKDDRFKYWLSQGAQPTKVVDRLYKKQHSATAA